MNIIKKISKSLCLVSLVTLFFALSVNVKVNAAESSIIYTNDPRLNEKAIADIVVNPNAVYGFSPDPNSVRLGTFADYDWTDKDVVEKAKLDRIKYHIEMQGMYDLWNKLESEGKSKEEIARAVSGERNRIRLASYDGDPVGLAKVKESNLAKYGNENGPTADSLYEKYGSWDTVLLKSFSENPGMDACLGLYDIYFPNYVKTGELKANGGQATYTVVNGDSLYEIAKKYFGNGSKCLDIAKDNSIKDANVILPGQTLVISIK